MSNPGAAPEPGQADCPRGASCAHATPPRNPPAHAACAPAITCQSNSCHHLAIYLLRFALSLITYHLSRIACDASSSCYHLSICTYHLSLAMCHVSLSNLSSSRITYHLPCIMHHFSYPTHHLSLITYHLPSIMYHLPYTTHH